MIFILWNRIMQVLPSQGLLASFRLCLNFQTAALSCENWYKAEPKYAGTIWRAARAPACLACSHRWLGVQAALQHHYNIHVCLLAHRVCISICWKPDRLHSFQWYSSGKDGVAEKNSVKLIYRMSWIHIAGFILPIPSQVPFGRGLGWTKQRSSGE